MTAAKNSGNGCKQQQKIVILASKAGHPPWKYFEKGKISHKWDHQ